MESLRRDFNVFRRGIECDDGCTFEGIEFSASPASRRKSTISASVDLVLPTSDDVIRSPNAAVVLFTPDMESEVTSDEYLLWKRE